MGVFKIIKIIGGSRKGFQLKTKPGTTTRPTLNRIRENLFNILQQQMPQSIGLDLFAGSGAIGIEALSRGAKEVYFVENNTEATAIIKNNLNKTDFKAVSHLYEGSWQQFLNRNTVVFDWIYVDPPYDLPVYLDVIETVSQKECLKAGGCLIIETEKKQQLKEEVGRFTCVRSTRYGNSILWFYKEM